MLPPYVWEYANEISRRRATLSWLMSVFIRNVLLCVNIRKENRYVFGVVCCLLRRKILRCCESRLEIRRSVTWCACSATHNIHNDMLTIDEITFSQLSLLFIIQCDQAAICARFLQQFFLPWVATVVVAVDIYKLSCHFCFTDTVKFYLLDLDGECLSLDESESESVSINGCAHFSWQPAYPCECVRRLSHLMLLRLN